jgi:hypothetical protein
MFWMFGVCPEREFHEKKDKEEEEQIYFLNPKSLV